MIIFLIAIFKETEGRLVSVWVFFIRKNCFHS